MSSVGNAFQSEAKRSYLTARVFNNDFYSYNQTVNGTTFQVSFALGSVPGATSGTCPVGRFLHETGRKLIPGANGGINSLMVGVYDPVSGLSGFIDPNCESFTIMNTDRSANLDVFSGGVLQVDDFAINPNGDTSDLANPVYTRGDVTALGQATITGNIRSLTGDITAVTGNVVAKEQVYSSTVTTLTVDGSGVTSMDISLGQTFTVSSDIDFGLNATGMTGLAGAVVRVIITNPAGGTDPINVVLGTPIRELYNGTGIATNLVATVPSGIPVSVNTGLIPPLPGTYTGTTTATASATVNFNSSGARNFQIPNGISGVITFLCDGTDLLEMSRCLVNSN
jgi:hypothetical protein